MEERVAVWTAVAKTLVLVAVKWPQMAYARFILNLQNKWQYAQHVVIDTRPFFVPLKVAIQKKFLPILIVIVSYSHRV